MIATITWDYCNNLKGAKGELLLGAKGNFNIPPFYITLVASRLSVLSVQIPSGCQHCIPIATLLINNLLTLRSSILIH